MPDRQVSGWVYVVAVAVLSLLFLAGIVGFWSGLLDLTGWSRR